MNIDAYLKRIEFSGALGITYDTLSRLQECHLKAVPFENLNIHIPKPIILTEDALFEKLVTQKRGGFCFEQNGLFAWVLRTFGFDVTMLEAGVYDAEGDNFGAVRFNHMALMVKIEDLRFLVDVGFGAAFMEPLVIDIETEQDQDVGVFKISAEGDYFHYHEKMLGAEEFSLSYRFDLTPRQLSDFNDACTYMQTSPDTHFTQKRVCSKWIDDARITLSENKFIHTTFEGERNEITVDSELAFHQILREEFGVDVETKPPAPPNNSPLA